MKKKPRIDESNKWGIEIAVCIAIQKIGQATSEEIVDKVKEWELNLEKKKVDIMCRKLQKKGIVSLNYRNVEGIMETCYSLSKAIFQRDVPIAHYKDVVDYPEAKELIKDLEGKKGANKGRLPDHRDYYIVNVKWKVSDGVLGLMTFHNEEFLEHYRNDEGEIMFLPSHFRAYLRRNMRIINKTETVANYLGYDYGKVNMKGHNMKKMQFSILDGNQGKGVRKYEVIPSGVEITTNFRVPESDFKSTEFKSFLTAIGKFPIRGFGGRSSVMGRLELDDYKVN